MDPEPAPTSAPRVVLLGASNLTRGISTVVGTAQSILDAPGEYLIAMGHGRSYGRPSRVVARTLPGIDECGLWNALRSRADRPTYALLTDVGNDIAYGHDVETIVTWIDRCLGRLIDAQARVVVTLLPMASLEGLSAWRYRLARTLLFPGSRISLAETLSRARRLNDGLRALGRDHGVHGVRLVEHEERWYGLDPIHIRRRFLASAWRHILGGWRDEPAGGRGIRPSVARWVRLRRITPQRWWLLGRELGREQPAGRLRDGATVSVF